jgi:glycosyltransferase involved in cell wall biosynthesis
MVKILIVTCRSDHGGGPKHISMLLETLHGKFDFFIAAPSSGHYVDLFKKWTNNTIDLPHRQFSLFAFIRLCRFARTNGIDIVHSHGRGAGYYSRLLRLFLSGINVIHTHHGFYFQRLTGMKRIILVGLEKVVSIFTDAYIFVSQSEMNSAAQVGMLYEHKSYLISNGVHIVPLEERNPSPKLKHLIAVTRLEPEKGNYILIRIVAELSLKRNDFVLHIVGDGPERYSLESIATELNVKNYIEFLGYRNDVHFLLPDSDVLVSSSLGEAQGIAVIEAMVKGVPVVISKVLGHIDIVEPGKTGFLFEIDSPKEAAKMIDLLLTDNKLWRKIRLNAYEQAKEKFSADRMTRETEALYYRVRTK